MSTLEDKTEHPNPLNYMDLLMLTLFQHEKILSMLIERLEAISERLDKINKQMAKKKSRH